jgi:hypothetical protein
MPPPGGVAGLPAACFGSSAIMASVVIRNAATEAAFWRGAGALACLTVGDTVAPAKELSRAILGNFPDFRGGPSGGKLVRLAHTTFQRSR